MKKAVYIVGAGLVIGGAATIYMLNKKRTTHTMNNVYPESETTSEKEESLAKTETSLDKGTQRKTTENELPSLTQCTA